MSEEGEEDFEQETPEAEIEDKGEKIIRDPSVYKKT